MFVEVARNVLGDELAALGLDEVLQPRHVDVSVDDRRDVLVRVYDAGLLAHSVLCHEKRVSFKARDLRRVLSVGARSTGSGGATDLGLLDLKHLLIFFRVLLNLLVEEEVGDTESDSMSLLAICRVFLLQLLEELVACQAPSLR